MSKDASSPSQSIRIDPAPRGDIAASVALLGAAAVVLAMLACLTAPVTSSDAQNLSPRVEVNSTIGREPDDWTRPVAGMTASLSSPHVSFAARAAPSGPTSYSIDAERKRVALFFGFVDFDWDPHAPGGVPGFAPMW